MNTPRDVRMKGFSSRSTVEQAMVWLDSQARVVRPSIGSEMLAVRHAAGRVLLSDVLSRVDVPMFDRAMMDGFALHAEDTSGASTYNRLELNVVGTALPNQPFPGIIQRGQAIRIMTGSPVPDGANAVLPVEQTESDSLDVVSILGELPPQKNIGLKGEDIRAGETALTAGRILRPQDVGLLSSIGVGEVEVVRPIRVRVLVTGNELLPPGSIPTGFQIVDANGPMLSALASRDGGVIVDDSIVDDNPIAILEAMNDDVDIVLVSGGSSVGQEDYAPRLLAEHGELAIHGVAMRPSSPSGMGMMGNKFVFLLPGNPVSCLCSYDFFAGRMIRQLAGLKTEWPYDREQLPLARKLVSQVGRVDYARVRIANGKVEPIAISGASVLSSTTRADGFIVVPADSEGFAPESIVEVWRYG